MESLLKVRLSGLSKMWLIIEMNSIELQQVNP